MSEREAELTGLLGDAIWPEGNPIGVSSREARLVDGVDELLADTLGETLVTPLCATSAAACDTSRTPHFAPTIDSVKLAPKMLRGTRCASRLFASSKAFPE